MDNDIFIPFKLRASQIVGVSKVAVKAIETEGIKLRESFATELEEVKNAISWFNGATLREQIYGKRTQEGVVHTLFLQAIGTVRTASLSLSGADEAGNANGGISVAIAGIQRTIVNFEEKSSFLQLVGALAKVKINFGTVEVEWPGANPASNGKKVAHGLTVIPKVFLLIGQGFVGAYGETAGLGTATETEVRGVTSAGTPVAGTKEKFSWIAIG